MSSQQSFVPLPPGFFLSLPNDTHGIIPDVCSRIIKIRVEIHLVIRRCRHEKNHLVGSFNPKLPTRVRHASPLQHGPHRDGILHVIIIQLPRVNNSRPLPIGPDLPARNGIRSIRENQMLPPPPICRESYHHHLIGVRDKTFPTIIHPILPESHDGHGRIERQYPLVVFYPSLVNTRPHVKLPHRRETPETGRLLGARFVRNPTVKIPAGKPCRLVEITFRESLSYIFQHVCRLLVRVPITSSTFCRVRPAPP